VGFYVKKKTSAARASGVALVARGRRLRIAFLGNGMLARAQHHRGASVGSRKFGIDVKSRRAQIRNSEISFSPRTRRYDVSSPLSDPHRIVLYIMCYVSSHRPGGGHRVASWPRGGGPLWLLFSHVEGSPIRMFLSHAEVALPGCFLATQMGASSVTSCLLREGHLWSIADKGAPPSGCDCGCGLRRGSRLRAWGGGGGGYVKGPSVPLAWDERALRGRNGVARDRKSSGGIWDYRRLSESS
jgi:hypothetical protein